MLLKQDFFFRSLGADRPLHIRVPDEGEGPYPVMYFFDGHNLFRDEDATYGTCWGLDEYLASWGKPLILVGVECGHVGDERLSEYLPYPAERAWLKGAQPLGEKTMEGILFELDLEEETMARVCALGEKYGVPVCAAVSNMAIALERRAYLPRLTSLVCNRQELGLLSPGDWEGLAPEALAPRLETVRRETGLPSLIVTLGADGAVWSEDGAWGCCPAAPAELVDTTGAGDAFFAGVGVGLCRGRGLAEACRIGALLAAGAVGSRESVCPPMPLEKLGL